MTTPRVYADFQNADPEGRLRLNCVGTINDLARQQLHLRDGLRLTVYSDDGDADGEPCELRADAVVRYSDAERVWVAVIDWKAIAREAEAGQA